MNEVPESKIAVKSRSVTFSPTLICVMLMLYVGLVEENSGKRKKVKTQRYRVDTLNYKVVFDKHILPWRKIEMPYFHLFESLNFNSNYFTKKSVVQSHAFLYLPPPTRVLCFPGISCQ